jgi:hypothetical protein
MLPLSNFCPRRLFLCFMAVFLLLTTAQARENQVDVYIAWTGRVGSHEQVFLSHLEGGHWSKALQLSNSRTMAFWPAVASDGQGRTWAVWSQYDRADGETSSLYYIRKTGSSPWSRPERINTGLKKNSKAELVVDGHGVVWLAWEGIDDMYPDIYVSSWSASGWTTPRKMHQPNRVPDINPRLMTDEQGAVCLTWKTFTENGYRPLAARLSDTGWMHVAGDCSLLKQSMQAEVRALRLPSFAAFVEDARQGRVFLRIQGRKMSALPLTVLFGAK